MGNGNGRIRIGVEVDASVIVRRSVQVIANTGISAEFELGQDCGNSGVGGQAAAVADRIAQAGRVLGSIILGGVIIIISFPLRGIVVAAGISGDGLRVA